MPYKIIKHSYLVSSTDTIYNTNEMYGTCKVKTQVTSVICNNQCKAL